MFQLESWAPDAQLFKTEGIFLNGFEFSDLVEKDTLYTLGEERGYGLCYEVAALSMFALADNHSAKLIHGIINDKDPHAWVEFYDDCCDSPLVLSPTYLRNIVIPAPIFLAEDDWEIKPIWTCNFQDFWDYPESEDLYALTEFPDTSKDLLAKLEVYRPKDGEGFGFK